MLGQEQGGDVGHMVGHYDFKGPTLPGKKYWYDKERDSLAQNIHILKKFIKD